MSDEEVVFLEQFGFRVTDFSSQYGNAGGVSYTANNILGPPSRFPAYGDFSETFLPRTYGRWWNTSPCSPPALNSSAEEYEEMGQDFVDVQFHKAVYPFCVSVYETYNSGCIRRIYASDGKGMWKLLHSQKSRQKSLNHSQIFSSEPCHIDFKTSIIRLEIDSSLADYFPEYDAVQLVGTESRPPSIEETMNLSSILGLTKRVMNLGLHRLKPDFNVIDSVHKFCFSSPPPENSSATNYLTMLPEEIIRAILIHLDLRSLNSVACVCTLLYNACKDPLLFTSVNLKPYWYCVDASALNWLSARSRLLTELELSWCGAYGKLSASDFIRFIKQSGQRLRILRLENCTFLNNEAIYWISVNCPSLQELNMRGCRQLESSAFWHLGRLRNIERLILDCTQIELPTLLVNVQSMTSLTHLSIASCHGLALGGSLDEIVRWLSRYRTGLQTLDTWRSGHFTNHGIEMLMGLVHLRELDIGWCGLPPNGHWISRIASRCRSLEKLVLTAARVVTDEDLAAIAQFCCKLRQLDLLGSSYITHNGCTRILERCRKLELLDVSYCGQIEESHVVGWKRSFPHVSIKRIYIIED